MQSSSRTSRVTASLATSALVAGSAAALLGAGTSAASSHREAPLTLADPTIDNTDVYAFVSPDAPDTVTLVSDWQGFQEPSQGPNYYPWSTDAHYNVKIDNDADAIPDVTYRWTFTDHDRRGEVEYDGPDGSFLYNNGPVTSFDDENLLFKQTYTLERIDRHGTTTVVEDGIVAPHRVGDASMPDYQGLRDEAVMDVGDHRKSFVGQADDPFFLDLRVFDLLYGGDLSEVGNDGLAGYNVNSVALQVPISDLVAQDGKDPVIGIWSTTDRPSIRVQNPDGSQEYSGDMVQVSRLGNPLVNEVVVPADLKDTFNALAPRQDAEVEPLAAKVLDPEVPKLLEAIYGLEAKPAPREDLFAIFLTGLRGLNRPAKPIGEVRPAEVLRLNTSVPPAEEPQRLGALVGDNAGFPNGRRLSDDVVDIEVQALAGAVTVSSKESGTIRDITIVEALAAGDAVDSNDKELGATFPYLALPHSGSDVAVGADGGSDDASEGTEGAGAAAAAPTDSTGTGASTLLSTVLTSSPAPMGLTLAAVGLLAALAGVVLSGRRGTPVTGLR